MASSTSVNGTDRETLFACFAAISLCARGSVRESLSVGEQLAGGESDMVREGGEGMMSYMKRALSSHRSLARAALGNRASAFRSVS